MEKRKKNTLLAQWEERPGEAGTRTILGTRLISYAHNLLEERLREFRVDEPEELS